MTKEETIKVLQSIEDRAVDFPYMTACDWVAIAAAKRHLENSLEVKDVQEEPVSGDLEEAAMQYAKSKHKDTTLQQIVSWDFKAGAQWKEEQCQKTIELAEDHAYLAGQEKIITKTCEFIETYPHLFMGVLRSEVIEDFKKVMEE